MKIKNILLFIITILVQSSIFAQNLESHIWEDRVILLFAPSLENNTLQKQLNIFEKNQEGLKDRKLVIYQISPRQVKKDGNDFIKNKSTNTILKKYKPKKDEFTFILIGLDGGVKMRSEKVISIEKLFGKIDQMPMRRAEMRRKN